VKPIGRAVELRRRLAELAARRGEPPRVVVVGGGAAGVEVACAADRVLSGGPRTVTLLEAGPRLLGGSSRRFAARTAGVLAARGIAVRTHTTARDVRAGAVELADGALLAADLVVWLTRAVGDPLFKDSGLRLDDRGFLLVDPSLRALDHPEIHAVGDCATLDDYPDTPKAGVYAVRGAPVLWESLVAAADGNRAPNFRPQRGFLALLNTADGKALLTFHGLVAHSRWAWRLKDHIDRGFMAKYRV
jgi:selenide,water dikinase